MTNDTGLIAVTDGMKDTAGAVVFWRMSGDVDLAELRDMWLAGGLEEALLPGAVSEQTALHRAMRDQAGPRLLLRPLEKHKGWALVHERADGEELLHNIVISGKVDANGLHLGGPQVEGIEGELAGRIRTAYAHYQTALTPNDISVWMTGRLLRKVSAVALRDTGGFYFVPREHMANWRRMVTAVRATSAHHLYEMPALRSTEAVQAVLDAITEEAEAEAAKMEEELAGGALGKRALEGRVERAQAVKTKVAGYETLLDTKMDALRERLDHLRANIAAAVLSADEAEEAA